MMDLRKFLITAFLAGVVCVVVIAQKPANEWATPFFGGVALGVLFMTVTALTLHNAKRNQKQNAKKSSPQEGGFARIGVLLFLLAYYAVSAGILVFFKEEGLGVVLIALGLLILPVAVTRLGRIWKARNDQVRVRSIGRLVKPTLRATHT